MLNPDRLATENYVAHQRSFGRGQLSVKQRDHKTRIDNLYQVGCAKIRIPNTFGQDLQAVMINSSGGMTGGDKLEWQFDVGAKTALTVTSQACERVYKAVEDTARTDVSISIGQNASLAWLPQETILFDGGSFARTINVDMDETSRLLMVEPIVFGRAAMDETVAQGYLRDQWRIRQNGKLIHAENMLMDGDIENQLQSNSMTKGDIATASVLLIAPDADAHIPAIRAILGTHGGASFWQGKLLVRLTAPSSYALRAILIPIINQLNNGATVPKIWKL